MTTDTTERLGAIPLDLAPGYGPRLAHEASAQLSLADLNAQRRRRQPESGLGHGDHPNDGYLYEGCPGCHPVREPAGAGLCTATQQTETWGLMRCGLFAGHPGGPPDAHPPGHHWYEEGVIREPASPAEPGLDELREAGGGYEVRTWVRHEPSGVVILKSHPQLGGRYCLTDGGDWPCATVRAALSEPKLSGQGEPKEPDRPNPSKPEERGPRPPWEVPSKP